MEDIGLVKQGWKWLRSQKDACSRARIVVGCCKDGICSFSERHWPKVCSGSVNLVRLLHYLVFQWKNCMVRGFRSSIAFGSAALLFIMWSFFLSLTSLSCLAYVLLSMVCDFSFFPIGVIEIESIMMLLSLFIS
jgi:DnaJ family protein C protein 14